MAVTPLLIADQGPKPAPASYDVPASQEISPTSVFAEFNGSGAAGPFLPCLVFVAQSGEVLSRTFPQGVTMNPGDSARVTYLPLGLGGSSAAPSAMSLIQTFTLLASTPTIEFTAIPQTFRSLMLVTYLRTDFAGNLDVLAVTLNGDTSAAYWTQRFAIEAGNTFPGEDDATNAAIFAEVSAAGSVTGAYAALTATFPGYALPGGQKIATASWALTKFAQINHTIGTSSLAYTGTAAINAVALTPVGGTVFVAGSQASLYGL